MKGANLGTSGITSVHMMRGRPSRSGGGAAIACDSVPPRERPASLLCELARADSGRDELRCTAVEGIGVVDVTVNVNGQCASAAFEFAPPRLDQAPRRDARGYLLPTTGGLLPCDGANFGSTSLGVSLELLWSASPAEALQPTPLNARFDILSHDHTQIVLRVPPGAGRGASFAFEVDGTRTNVVEFAYEAPSLDSVSPSLSTPRATQSRSLARTSASQIHDLPIIRSL